MSKELYYNVLATDQSMPIFQETIIELHNHYHEVYYTSMHHKVGIGMALLNFGADAISGLFQSEEVTNELIAVFSEMFEKVETIVSKYQKKYPRPSEN